MSCVELGIPGLDNISAGGCKPAVHYSESDTLNISGNGSTCEPLSIELKEGIIPTGSTLAGWSLTGNTLSGGEFIGSLNDQNVVVKRNNVNIITVGSENTDIQYSYISEETVEEYDAQFYIGNDGVSIDSEYTVSGDTLSGNYSFASGGMSIALVGGSGKFFYNNYTANNIVNTFYDGVKGYNFNAEIGRIRLKSVDFLDGVDGWSGFDMGFSFDGAKYINLKSGENNSNNSLLNINPSEITLYSNYNDNSPGSNTPFIKFNVTGTTISTLSGTGTRMVTADASGKLDTQDIPSGSGSSWALSGNTGTDSGINFIGTTDEADLVLKHNSRETVRMSNNDGGFYIDYRNEDSSYRSDFLFYGPGVAINSHSDFEGGTATADFVVTGEGFYSDSSNTANGLQTHFQTNKSWSGFSNSDTVDVLTGQSQVQTVFDMSDAIKQFVLLYSGVNTEGSENNTALFVKPDAVQIFKNYSDAVDADNSPYLLISGDGMTFTQANGSLDYSDFAFSVTNHSNGFSLTDSLFSVSMVDGGVAGAMSLASTAFSLAAGKGAIHTGTDGLYLAASDIDGHFDTTKKLTVSFTGTTVEHLAGTGTRMVTANPGGKLDTQAIPLARYNAGWTWKTITPSNYGTLVMPTYDDVNGKYIVLLTQGATKVVMYSANGENWTQSSTLPNVGNTWFLLSSGGGYTVMLATSGTANRSSYSTDGGATFTAGVTTGVDVAYGNLCWVSGTTFIATLSTSSNIIYKTTDGGANWSSAGALLTNANIWTSIVKVNNGRMLIAANTGTGTRIKYSDDGGATWTNATANDNPYRQFCYCGGNVVLLPTTISGIYSRSTDNGATWQDYFLDPNFSFRDMVYISGSTVITKQSNTSDIVYISYDLGLTWEKSQTPFHVAQATTNNGTVSNGSNVLLWMGTNSTAGAFTGPQWMTGDIKKIV